MARDSKRKLRKIFKKPGPPKGPPTRLAKGSVIGGKGGGKKKTSLRPKKKEETIKQGKKKGKSLRRVNQE